MSNYSNFGSMLSNMTANDNLPKMLFTGNGDLRGSLSRLSMLTSVNDKLNKEDIQSAVENYAEIANNKLENGEHTALFEKISDLFAKKINDGLAVLREIKNDVTELNEKINKSLENKIASDITLSKVYNVSNELTMANVAWEQFDKIDEQALIANVNVTFGRDINDEITKPRITQLINKIPCANQYNKTHYDKVLITKEKFDKICYAVQNKLPHIGVEQIAGIFRTILDLNENQVKACIRVCDEFASGKTANQINKYINLSVEYIEVIDALTDDILNISESTKVEYDKHVQAMQAISEALLYTCSYYRTEWKDSVLVPGPYANPDAIDDFKANGGTITNIVQHVNKFYTEDNVPVKGVTGAFISQTADTISKEISQEIVKHTKDISNKKRQMERDSFVYVGTEYLNAHKANFSKGFSSSKNISKYVESIYNSNMNLPNSEKLYKLIMGSCHINDIVSTMYTRLKNAYTEESAKLGEISQESKNVIDTKVYADMISEYLVDSGLLVI